jgi:hypothetical protein
MLDTNPTGRIGGPLGSRVRGGDAVSGCNEHDSGVPLVRGAGGGLRGLPSWHSQPAGLRIGCSRTLFRTGAWDKP